MNPEATIILLHQLVFQGMFLAKNLYLKKKLGVQIRGKNREAVLSVLFITGFILASIVLGMNGSSNWPTGLTVDLIAIISATVLIMASLLVSAFSLIGLKDSWRVGVIEDQETELVETGIYSKTRNPYFLSYICIFIGYTLLLQSALLLGMSFIGLILIHLMIKKEEACLARVHGKKYADYKQRVPRYILI